MIRAATVALLCLALSGCGQQTPNDGYAFERKEFTRTDIALRIVEHPTQEDLRFAATQMGVKAESKDLMAFSTFSPTQATCTIHMVDAHNSYEPTWMGHELAHCVYGRWHGIQQVPASLHSRPSAHPEASGN
jgi:type IV pilus biogenesis protein CpaD/CtpE